jgi:hypothetical protein
MSAVHDQYPVENLSAYRADPSLSDPVRPRCAYRCAKDADDLAGEHGIEGAGELGVPISDQELECRQTVAEVHHEVASLLGNPRTAGVGGDSEQVNVAGGVLHDEQHV